MSWNYDEFQEKKLANELYTAIKEKFPEVELMSITESPEDPADLWLNIAVSTDEDREIEIREFASEKSTDILLDYGLHILAMPRPAESLAMS